MKYLLSKIATLYDWELITLVFAINIIGFMAIYSASQNYGTESYFYLKQIGWFFIGLVFMSIICMISFNWIMRFAYLSHLGVIFLLVLTLTYGGGNKYSDVNRWLDLGFIYLQPSEFAKFTLVLALAAYFKDTQKIGSLRWHDLLITGTMTLVPVALIFRQPDFGTAAVLLIIYAVTIFMMGLNYKVIFSSLFLGVLFTPLGWNLLKPYQQDRIISMFDPESDPLGKGYHLIQSKIAIGSGGISGKGFLEGKQAQLNFLPAKHTDFIFSLFSEEWGFMGSMFLLALYYAFLIKCISFVKKSGSKTGAVICTGITTIFFTHILVNVSMVMGLMPVVGIPLPFFSYGGSSMLSMMLGIGLALNSLRNSRYY